MTNSVYECLSCTIAVALSSGGSRVYRDVPPTPINVDFITCSTGLSVPRPSYYAARN